MRRALLIGFTFGLLCSFLWFAAMFSGMDSNAPEESLVRDFLVWISTPAAHVVSWIIDSPLQQEAGIYIYTFYAIPITLLLLGLLLGITVYSTISIIRKAR